MSLNANLIKELREKSGAGIVDCKNALLQNDNDVNKSIDWLRKKGLSVAAKKKISFLEEIYHVADDWNFYSKLGLKIGYIYPTLVIEDLNQKSTLEHNEGFFRASRSNNRFINGYFLIKDYALGFIRRLILKFKIKILELL